MNADEARPDQSGQIRRNRLSSRKTDWKERRKREEKGKKKKNMVFSYSNMGVFLGSCRTPAGRTSTLTTPNVLGT